MYTIVDGAVEDKDDYKLESLGSQWHLRCFLSCMLIYDSCTTGMLFCKSGETRDALSEYRPLGVAARLTHKPIICAMFVYNRNIGK